MMRRVTFARLMFGLLLLMGGIAGVCNTTPPQANETISEELLATATPTPSVTSTQAPTATRTPIPPTHTSLPPTDTPTNTPTATPIVTVAPPLSFVTLPETEGDATVCDTQNSVDDPEVDIATVQVAYQPNQLLFSVNMKLPLVTDYSFAVAVSLLLQNQPRTYLWEIHDTAYRIGQLDYQTGEMMSETSGNVVIDHDREAGKVNFSVPLTHTTTISSNHPTIIISSTTTIPATANQLYIASFHTPQVNAAKNCDTVGPYSFTVGVPSSP